MATTTTITVTAPAAIPQSIFQEQSATSASAQPKVTFEPVAEAIITQIMGYVSLGLPEIGVDPKVTPGMVYRWHTWLSRMNDWMNKNRKVYPRFMELPAVKVPAPLYYLENLKEQSVKTANAMRAPLGPLSPIDMNTFVNALRKGVEGCNDAEREHNVTTLTGFVNDVNKLATFAIEPHKYETSSLSPIMMVLPERDVDNLASVEDGSTVTTNAVFPLPPLGRIVESFIGRGRGSMLNLSNFATVPIWCWVVALMLIMYIFIKPSGNDRIYGNDNYEIDVTDTTSAMLTGGNAHGLNKIISISDFNVPNRW